MRHSSTRTFAAVMMTLALSGPVGSQTFNAITIPTTPIYGIGFKVSSPASPGWMLAIDRASEAFALTKSDPDHASRRGSIIVVAARIKAKAGTIDTLEGLRYELEQSIRASSSRRTLVSLTLEPRFDTELNTDCIRISSSSEERGNLGRAGEVLLMSIAGKACRHPSSQVHYVQVTYSERRPRNDPPLMDDALRNECEGIIDSLKFMPIS